VDTGTKDHFDYLRYISVSEQADQKAILRDLMTAYGDDVWNFAFSLCRRADMAQDITQDVFLKVYRSLGSFRGDSSAKTWILAITRNTAADYKRSAFFRKVTLQRFAKQDGCEKSAEQEAMENLAIHDIWKKVLKLPAKYREVLVLSAHHQLTMKEMAEILGVSEGTVKSRLYHARVKVLKMKERDTNEAL
jgi:RNA polymerase sigma-70 factor (ECF subfamily)